jgi:hypothetical protein
MLHGNAVPYFRRKAKVRVDQDAKRGRSGRRLDDARASHVRIGRAAAGETIVAGGQKFQALAGMLVAGLCTFTSAAAAAAGDTIFTVGNYPVEARAGDAVTAKNRAVADGQKAALRSLIKRLVPVTAYERVRKMQIPNAANMVSSTSVRTERNSSTDYIASLDFAFQPQAVRALLDREGIPYVDQQAPVVTIVPIWRAPIDTAQSAGQMPSLFGPTEGPKAWTDAWKGLDLDHALTPVKLAALKADMPADVIKGLANGDASQWRTFAAAYGTDKLVAAIAEPDMASKKLKLTLIGGDAVGAITWRPVYRLDMSDPGYALELAGVVSLRVLEGRWKAVNAKGDSAAAPSSLPGATVGQPGSGQTSSAGQITITVEFRGMGEWQDISRRLGATPGIENLDVLGMSGRSARVSLSYPGGAERLVEALAAEGISMRQGGQGWVIAGR